MSHATRIGGMNPPLPSANQALSAEWVSEFRESLGNKVYRMPADIDKKIARIKLRSKGVTIDKLTQD